MSKGIEKLPDGFTHNPVFLIRNLLRLLPAYYVRRRSVKVDDRAAYMPDDIFCQIMAASYVRKERSGTDGLARLAHQGLSGVLFEIGGGAG